MKKYNLFLILLIWLLLNLLAGCTPSTNTPTTVTTPPTPTPVADKGILMYPLTIGSWWQYDDTLSNPSGTQTGSLKITVTGSKTLPNGKTVVVMQLDNSVKGSTTLSTEFRYVFTNGNFLTFYTDTSLKSADPFFSYNFPLSMDTVFKELDVFNAVFLDTIRVSKPATVNQGGKIYDGVYTLTKHIYKDLGSGRYGPNFGDWVYQILAAPGIGNIRMKLNYHDLNGISTASTYWLTDYRIQ